MMPRIMTHEEIIHLGHLSRIALSTEEVTAFSSEIDAILDYVSVVKTIVGDDALPPPAVGVRHTILRPDVVTEPTGTHTEVLLAAMPARDGQYLLVKKILNQSE